MTCYHCDQENEYGLCCDICDNYYCEDCLNGGGCAWTYCNLCGDATLMCGECLEKYHKCLTCNKGEECTCQVRNCMKTHQVTKEREEQLVKYIMDQLTSANPATKQAAQNAINKICENLRN